jgi:hypothetical protein
LWILVSLTNVFVHPTKFSMEMFLFSENWNKLHFFDSCGENMINFVREVEVVENPRKRTSRTPSPPIHKRFRDCAGPFESTNNNYWRRESEGCDKSTQTNTCPPVHASCTQKQHEPMRILTGADPSSMLLLLLNARACRNPSTGRPSVFRQIPYVASYKPISRIANTSIFNVQHHFIQRDIWSVLRTKVHFQTEPSQKPAKLLVKSNGMATEDRRVPRRRSATNIRGINLSSQLW